MNAITPPHDEKIENGVLSGIVFNTIDVDEAIYFLDMLEPEMFYNEYNQKIFEEYSTGIRKTKKSFMPKLLTSMSGEEQAAWIEFPFMRYMIEGEIAKLKELATKRKLIRKTYEFMTMSQNNMVSCDDIIKNVNEFAEDLSASKQNRINTTIDVIKSSVKRVKDAMSGISDDRIKYQHECIDDKVMIFRKQMHTIGADQAGGKTALSLDCLRRQIKSGMNVVYFCTESSADELLLRMIGSEIKVDMQSMMTGTNMTSDVMNRFAGAIKEFKDRHDNFWIIGLGDWDCTTRGANIVLSRIFREKGSIDMVYWDFLQDMLPPRDNHKIDIIETIRLSVAGIKELTEKYNFASTVLSQFRKDKTNRKPQKHDFWGASSIINASHIMSCIYNSEDYDNQEPPAIQPRWFYSVKTRLIKEYSKQLMFNGAHGIFTNPSRFSDSDRPVTYGGKYE